MGKIDVLGCALAAVFLGACGGGDDGTSESGGFPADTTCGMSIALSGAWNETIPKSSSIACATNLSSDAGIDAGFLPTAGETTHYVGLAIDDVKKDETGAGFPAELQITHTDQRKWTASGCTATVTAHALAGSDGLFDLHRIAGSVGCETAATSDGGDAPLTVESFAFVCSVPWTK
jgi:hypothetical protein